jgi:hypothetical protein
MSERAISRQDVKVVIQGGEILESYELDKPFPSFLIYGKCDDRVLHIVVCMAQYKSTRLCDRGV